MRTRLVNYPCQVPPEEVLIIGCDRRPALPVIVKNNTITGGYSSFWVKHKITGDFTTN